MRTVQEARIAALLVLDDTWRELEEIRTAHHDDAVMTTPIDGFRICEAPDCRFSSAALRINGVPYCTEHAPRRLTRLLWDARIRTLLRRLRYGGFFEASA